MAVRKGKQYYSSGEEKGKIMLDRFKVTKVPICQCSFSIGVTAGASNQKTGANGEKHLTMAWCCTDLLEKMVLPIYLP